MEETTAIKSLPKTYQDIPRSRGLSPKVWLAGSFLLTALILMGIAYYVLNYTDFSVDKIAKDFGDTNQVSALEVVTVPKMEGESYSDWVNKLKETNVYKFTVKIASQEFSEDVKEGYTNKLPQQEKLWKKTERFQLWSAVAQKIALACNKRN